ncbi:MAG TPA: bifunctional oligoribonuclease/PAP phosphatase NrnA [Solirubrobacteraceae bacterium]|nr:bifunctional oligoribonuclease/PAP phosphatase NrnA [Solirubrobacteraceae bacterium]
MSETVADQRHAERAEVLRELQEADKLVVVTHENPDGDALGSLIAMQGILSAIGKDCVMFIAQSDLPLPQEYTFLPLQNLITEPPADLAERTLVFLDCGNLDRNPAEAFKNAVPTHPHILNIDHHHDNTRFGTVNLVVDDASCTAEIVWELMRELTVTPTSTVAEALYVGLITDTGRFMYENTGRAAHLMAADLIDAGVDVHAIYRRVYEDMPYGKLALLARGLANVERYDEGRLTMSALTATDFSDSEAEESFSEGVIDHLRAVEGTQIAALVRDRIGNPDIAHMRKVSLRSGSEGIDVSVIARAQGGGGHKQAAGFSTALSHDELVQFLREQLAAQL